MNRQRHTLSKRAAISAALFWVFPLLAFAQDVTDIPSFVTRIITIINDAVIPLLIGVAFVTFLYGIYKYIVSVSVDKKEEGRTLIIYGLVGLFIMLSAWGLVDILVKSFFTGSDLNTPPAFPKVPSLP